MTTPTSSTPTEREPRTDYAGRMRAAVLDAVVALTSKASEGGTRYAIPGGPGIPEQPTYAYSAALIEEKVVEPLYEFARDEMRTRDGFPDPAAGAATETGGLPLDVPLLGTAMHNVGLTLCDNGGPGKNLDDVAAEYLRLSVHPDREDAPDGGGAT